MKEITIIASIALVVVLAMFHPGIHRDDDGKSASNIAYEQYCDSIWDINPDYYLDVLEETEEYQSYIEEHGQWWK